MMEGHGEEWILRQVLQQVRLVPVPQPQPHPHRHQPLARVVQQVLQRQHQHRLVQVHQQPRQPVRHLAQRARVPVRPALVRQQPAHQVQPPALAVQQARQFNIQLWVHI